MPSRWGVETVWLPIEVVASGRKKSSKLAILSRSSCDTATVCSKRHGLFMRHRSGLRLATRTARPDPGVRVEIQAYLIDQTRLLLSQPLRDRHRLKAVAAEWLENTRDTLQAISSASEGSAQLRLLILLVNLR